MRHDEAMAAALQAARDAGADDVEVSYCGGELYFARYARSRFTQVGTVATDHVRVRALVGRRLGAELCGSLARDAVIATARGAVEAARGAPELDVDLELGGGGEPAAATNSTAIAENEELSEANAPATLMRAFEVAREQGCECAGALKVTRRTVAVRTAAGASFDGADALTDIQLIAADGDSSGYCGRAGRPDQPFDIDAIARVAADKAARSRNASSVDAGEYDVVLAPEAVAELLEWMSLASFGAQSVIDGQSLLTGRTGETICDERVTITDRLAAGEVAFDAEGSARKPVTFIDAGKAGRPVTDRLTAQRLKDERGSTGHAAAVDNEHESGPAPVHLALAPGQQTEAELIASVDRGLYITRFHYVNGLLDTHRATMTGMTRDGTFAIDGGKLGGGVRNLRFTDSMLDAWSARLGGIGHETRDIPTWWSSGGLITTPALLIRGFRFTGQSR